MSTITRAMIAVLMAHPGTVGQIGNRAFLAAMPEGATLPALTIEQITGAPIHGIREDLDWHDARVQIDVYADTAAELSAAVAQVKAALRRYRGTQGSITFDDCMLDAEAETIDPTLDVHRTTLDFIIHFAE